MWGCKAAYKCDFNELAGFATPSVVCLLTALYMKLDNLFGDGVVKKKALFCQTGSCSFDFNPSFVLKFFVEMRVDGIILDLDPFEKTETNGQSLVEAGKGRELFFKVNGRVDGI